ANTNSANNTPTAVAAGGTAITGGVQILTASLPDAVIGLPYSANVSVTGGAPPYFFNPVTPPDGILFTGGAFSGTPAVAPAPTSSPASVSASRTVPLHASRDFPTRVPSPLNFASLTLATGTVGQAYAASLDAGGGLAPYKFSIASGSLPPGLALATTGAI